jgi:hypothetical protein
MLRASPLVAGFLPQTETLRVPNLMFNLATLPEVSAYFRHCGRFLEKRGGD